jgi:NTE family protein
MGNKIHLQLFQENWEMALTKDFNELPIPFKCVATDLETGEIVIFESGSLADAMRASISLPSIFLPLEIEGKLLIDGGISQNFPVDIAKKLGYDTVIGLRTNTEMAKKEDLNNPLNVLSQTLSIGLLYRQRLAEEYADIIITPDTAEFSMIDFKKLKRIVEAGYNEVKKYESFMLSLPKNSIQSLEKDNKKNRDEIIFSSITIMGNIYLSAPSVRNYLGLKTDVKYTKKEIMEAFKYAEASGVFDQIYPTFNRITDEKDEYELIVHIKEKERKHLGINFIYNQHDGFVGGAVLKIQNVVLKNSMLLVNTQFGGKQAFEIDYSKAFLKNHNIYYRLFPYYKTENIFTYDDNYNKKESYQINDFGFTAGIGSHINKYAIVEPYIYSYKLQRLKKIPYDKLENNFSLSTGVGAKLYIENLNDYPFYMKGYSLFSKFNRSVNIQITDIEYSKMVSELTIAQPITKKSSLIAKAEYGTYFKDTFVEQDPFYIGGIDNFIGLNQSGILAPYYKKITISSRINPYPRLFLDIKANYINYGDREKLLDMDHNFYGYGVELGYKSIIGPARIALSRNKDKKFFGYISLGYDYDAFFFSRR